jgi:hypothetical protein
MLTDPDKSCYVVLMTYNYTTRKLIQTGSETSEHLSLREQVTFDDDDVSFLFQLMLVHLCNVKMVGIVQSTFLRLSVSYGR